MEKIADVMSISGGKDSAAMWIYATKELGVKVIPVFADTGNEHPSTYEYLDYLERELGPIRRVVPDFTKQIAKKREYVINHWPTKLQKDIPGRWVSVEPEFEGSSEEDLTLPPSTPPIDIYKTYKGVTGWIWEPTVKGKSFEEAEAIVSRALEHLHPTGIPFLDLCIWKGRFPSTKARFCTEWLKIIPIAEDVYFPLLEDGYHIVSWQGVRAAESPARAKLPMREETPEGYEVYRPLLNWSARDVFDMHKKHGIEPNPLYSQGMSRVGCMPCINVNKGELFEISRRFPEEIARISEWERLVAGASRRGDSSFLPALDADDKKNIHDWVEWSKTSYGGHTYDLLKMISLEEPITCSSVYGLCE
ncbi:phosphoadenosine phosphosulfate reductase family protein [Paenibacillus sp. TAF43_2]|uniref:phosphoadenosine phosphosulfate reductase family protein n=1 Tax=Paenibacillus sp. TAF43_2 TaxID=3233069 RepID=UPI003F984BF9